MPWCNNRMLRSIVDAYDRREGISWRYRMLRSLRACDTLHAVLQSFLPPSKPIMQPNWCFSRDRQVSGSKTKRNHDRSHQMILLPAFWGQASLSAVPHWIVFQGAALLLLTFFEKRS